ncbi:hypothetical protein [Streptomyces sp. NPDC002467]|uniref:hypothetical protein n=1 Tax=Streptomyces sp. NPDC002467 TaxID=3364647 RepID=UPI0036C909D7
MPHTMVLAVHPAALERLDALVREHQDAEEQWLNEEGEREGLVLIRGAQRRAGQARIRPPSMRTGKPDCTAPPGHSHSLRDRGPSWSTAGC